MHYQGIIHKKILIKLTSRERNKALIRCVREAIEHASKPEELSWLFSFDTDDSQAPFAIAELANMIPGAYFSLDNSEGKIHAINRDIKEYEKPWDILVNLSDDQICQYKGWDDVVKDLMPSDLDASLWFRDGLQDRLNTMEIVGRKYFNRFGYIYDGRFKSFFCDNLTTDVGLHLNKLIKSDLILFKHHHPIGTRHALYDELYRKNDRYWKEDQDTYDKIKANGIENYLKEFGI